MKNLLEELFSKPFRGWDEFVADVTKQLRKHKRELSPELAASTRALAAESVRAGILYAAQAGLYLSSRIYSELSIRDESLYSYLEYLRVCFAMADSEEEYISIWEAADGIREEALEIQENNLAFLTCVLCANCSYFGGLDKQDEREKIHYLTGAVEKLVAAAEYCDGADDGASFNEFVSLVAAVIKEFRKLHFPLDTYHRAGYVEHIKNTLRKLAAAVERLIPIDFTAIEGLEKSLNEAYALASHSYDYGDPVNASQRLDVALARAEQQVKESHDLETWLSLAFSRYMGTRDSGGSQEELSDLCQAMRSRGEQFRDMFRSRGGRLWAAQELDQFHGQFLRDELEAVGEHFSSDLFYATELIKSRTLLDQIGEGGFRDFPTQALAEQATLMERDLLRFNPEEVRDNEPQKDQLWHSELRLASRLSIGFDDDRDDREQRMIALENFHGTYQAGFQHVTDIAEIEELTNALQPGEALIEYCIPHHRFHSSYGLLILILTSESLQAIYRDLSAMPGWENAIRVSADDRQPVALSTVGNRVCGLRIAIQMGDDGTAQPLLEELYDLLIRPVIEEGFTPQEYRRWIIIPHGMLHYVPFAALSQGQGHYLIQDVALTVAPSASAWLRLVKRQRPSLASFLGCANPDLSSTSLKPLPDAERELARIAKGLASLKCSSFTGKEATEEVLRLQAPGKSVIHLATHGDFPEQDAIDLHSILLTPTAQCDGHLSAEKVRKMDLHAARLVVLSICNGGLYRTGPGDEPYGLMAAFLIAGAENILGTLWPLDDLTGQFFMTDFYESLLQRGPAEALRQACLSFIQQKALLKDWANFVLVGSGRSWHN